MARLGEAQSSGFAARYGLFLQYCWALNASAVEGVAMMRRIVAALGVTGLLAMGVPVSAQAAESEPGAVVVRSTLHESQCSTFEGLKICWSARVAVTLRTLPDGRILATSIFTNTYTTTDAAGVIETTSDRSLYQDAFQGDATQGVERHLFSSSVKWLNAQARCSETLKLGQVNDRLVLTVGRLTCHLL